MPARFCLAFALLAAALLLVPSPAQAQARPKPGPFAAYAGTYTGTGTLTLSGSPFPGNVTVKFSSPSRGKLGQMTLTSTFGAGVSKYPANGTFAFTRSTFTLNAAVLGTFTPGYPINGTAGVSAKGIKFSGSGKTTDDNAYVASGTITPTFLKRKTILKITYTINVLGVPTTIAATVSKPVKP